MSLYYTDGEENVTDPMDLVESVVASDDRFSVERAEDGDVQFYFKGVWTEAAGYFSYRDELPALLFTLGFDLQATDANILNTMKLAAMINENLWLGHFDVWSDDGSIVFRHSAPMIGREEISPGEVQALLAAALDAADRFYPAFKFVIEGVSPEKAVEAAMFEVAGEA
ncbi:MAG: YbjN domain-containing protein [Caulobacterales bacterium]